MLVAATEAGLGFAKALFPGVAAAKVLIVAAAYVPAGGAWCLIAKQTFLFSPTDVSRVNLAKVAIGRKRTKRPQKLY